MKNHFALFALISNLIAAASYGCGDDEGSDGSGGSAGSAGDDDSGGTSSGGTNAGGTNAGKGGSSGAGNASGGSGDGGMGGGGGVPVIPPLCEELGSLCEPYALGPGPQRDCSALGLEVDEAVCEEQEDACRDACENADELPFALTFAAKVGSEAFSCGSTYTGLGADDSTVHPVDFRFYVHDIRLLDDSGAEVPVALTQDGLWQHEGVALLDFENRTGSCSNGTVQLNDVVVGTVPFGSYAGVAFKLGVPFELNHTDIATAPSPLNLSSMFWGWNPGRTVYFGDELCRARRRHPIWNALATREHGLHGRRSERRRDVPAASRIVRSTRSRHSDRGETS